MSIQNGVIPDPRPEHLKAQDHLHEERYSGLPVVWIEKPQSTWKLTTQRIQDGSGSCVKQSSESAKEVFLKQVTSAGGYQFRANKPDGGMWLQNCGDIDYNQGTVLEVVTPSQQMNDAQMDAIQMPSTLNIKITGYRTFQTIDIESIAEAIQSYGNCLLVFHSVWSEWLLTPVYNGLPTTFGHCINATDFTLINGVKTFVCNDSAGQESSPTGLRLITEAFLNYRCVGAMYYTGATIDATPKFQHVFNTDIGLGQSGPEVVALQTALILDGESIPLGATGYYGTQTQAAVKAFQSKYKVANPIILWCNGGKLVGVLTRNQLNTLFAGS